MDFAQLKGDYVHVVPMSVIAQEREAAFSVALRAPQATIIVMCHRGVRSMQVTQWMRAQGWQNVFSLRGGIDEYARNIDPGIGRH